MLGGPNFPFSKFPDLQDEKGHFFCKLQGLEKAGLVIGRLVHSSVLVTIYIYVFLLNPSRSATLDVSGVERET